MKVNSIQLKVLLWTFCMVTLAFVAFIGIGFYIAFSAGPAVILKPLGHYQLEEAMLVYEASGREGLERYVRRMDERFAASHYFTDRAGVDLLTGESRATLLPPGTPPGTPYRRGGNLMIAVDSADHRYQWITAKAPPIDVSAMVLNFLVTLAALALFSWLLAVHIAKPLAAMSETIDRFGAGDLGIRLRLRRSDEIGRLGRAFDHMAERLETLVGAERQLLQDISHELRSPLARLSVAAQLTRNAGDREAATGQIEREIERLTELVSDLVTSTRLEGAGPREPVAIRALLDELVEDGRVEASTKQCRIQWLTGGERMIEAVPELLRRALENILRNAIRHAPPGSAIDVALNEQADRVEIVMRDRGTGVPDDSLERIFHPFYRVDQARSSNEGGVGLGLAIAHRAVNFHHGEIVAENAAPGLRVTIRLPLVA